MEEKSVLEIIQDKVVLGNSLISIDNAYNICYIFDHNAVRGAGVSICSVCENNKDKEIIFHALCTGLKANDINKLEQITNKYNILIVLYFIDKNSSFFNNLVIGTFPITIWYRILLPYIVKCKKILYLDSDIINLGKLEEVFSLNIERYYLLAVPDTEETSKNRNRALNLGNQIYFNSGVLMINVEKWKNINASEEILKIAKDYGERLVLPDQDALNIFFSKREDVYYLDKKYNRVALWKEHNIKEKLSDTILLHFVQTKPWQENWLYEKRPYIENLFAKYEELSPWKGMPLERKAQLSYHDKRKRASFLFSKGKFLEALYWYKEYLKAKF